MYGEFDLCMVYDLFGGYGAWVYGLCTVYDFLGVWRDGCTVKFHKTIV